MAWMDKLGQLSKTVSDTVNSGIDSVGKGLDTLMDGGAPEGSASESTEKTCPHCGMQMPVGYVKCPHCNKAVEGVITDYSNSTPRISVDPTSAAPAADEGQPGGDLQKKIVALTNLMAEGVLTAQELAKLIAVLNESAGSAQAGGSPVENAYYKYIEKYITPGFKSPSSVKPAPFDSSMVKEGEITVDGNKVYTKYIESYVDAPNSYGTMLREPFIIGIDDEFNMYWHAMHLTLGPVLGKSPGWWKR